MSESLGDEAVHGVRPLDRLPDPRERPWLTVAEVAAITGEGEKVIRAALDAGQLPLLELGRYKRIPTAALLKLLEIDTPETSEAGTSTVPAATATVHTLGQRAGDPHDPSAA